MKDASYSDLEKAINHCPKTWVGALLILCAKRAATIPVFQPGKMAEVVQKVENEARR